MATANTPVRSPITTHVLNTASGTPAANLFIKLYRVEADGNKLLNSGYDLHILL